MGEAALLFRFTDPDLIGWKNRVWHYRYGVLLLAGSLSVIALGSTIFGAYWEKQHPAKLAPQSATTEIRKP
jgi:hypothetical protein